MNEEITWTHVVPSVSTSSVLVLACRCGILHTLEVSDAGVARIDCACGIVATLPVDGKP